MNIHWPCYGTVHVYVVIYMCDSMWSFRVEENQEGNVRIPLTNLTPIWPRNIVVPVPNQDMEFNITCQGLYCIQWVQLRSEVVVRFVHIGGIDDHHCLNCLFGHCIVCPSKIYGFWLPLWYLQTVLQDCVRWPHKKPTSLYHRKACNQHKYYLPLINK
jgi:hypothetical protein